MMKACKPFLVILLALMILAGGSSLAFAQVYEHAADSLAAMDLFQGTDKGYELERVPTRAEAAAVLVRLLGADAEAKAANYSHPFTDVIGWEAPYVGYLYEKGLASGMTATTFAPQQPCSSQMFYAFILRALGYGSDFAYADAEKFAAKLGLADVLSFGPAGLKRDSVVSIAYTALATPMKADAEGKAPLLLQHLVDSGAVDAAKAAPYLTQFAYYKAIQEASRVLESEAGLDMKLDMTMLADAGAGDAATNVAMTLASRIQMLGDPAAAGFKAALTNLLSVSIKADGATEKQALAIDIFVKDDTVYARLDMGEDGVMKYKLSLTSVQQMLAADPGAAAMLGDYTVFLTELEAMTPTDPYLGNYGIALMGPISRGKQGTDTVYSVDMSHLEGYLNQVINSLGDSVITGLEDAELALVMSSVSYQVNDISADYVLGANGRLKRIDMVMDFDTTAAGETVSTQAKVTMTILKTGGSVKVAYPNDLDQYVDILTLFQDPFLAMPAGLL